MDVAISTLRAELSTWIELVQSGEEVVVTDRGIPVARLVHVDTAPLLERLSRQGVLNKPRGGQRPASRDIVRAHASGPVADLITEQRR
ncbi:type II toxin-antitoxin system prevent-host-death family antitoxin [Salinibacterium sp.]|uniref:type II toxin-antitoxin system Phd/YefM family antitoxin n=1 Tax=Salinibacterium sp. TaxID=1915057 RepID=UPI00286AB870|nr:type II toxin-antitoxin system prevent-host-death family antitoxin [Salinibacterium sp.]